MVPVAHSQRSPVLLLMGGGMGAGKSTVLKDILKQYVIIHLFSPTSLIHLYPEFLLFNQPPTIAVKMMEYL